MINWQMLAINIRSSGLSLAKASEKIGRHNGFVSQLARGDVQEPSFSDGMKLLDLHLDRCPEKHQGIRR